MAYPGISDITTGYVNTNSSSSTIVAPSNTASGDLIVLIFTKDGTAAPTSVSDAGFTLLAGAAYSAQWHGIYYKELTGALSNFTVSHASEQTTWIIFRVTGGVKKTSVVVNTLATGSSTQPNPASSSVSAKYQSGTETLWLATAGWDYNRAISGYPSNMADNRTSKVGTTTGGCGTAMATTTSTSNSLDPSYFTIVSDTWCAYTIAFKIAIDNTKTLTSNVNISSSFTKKLTYKKSLIANVSITSTNPSRTITERGFHIERKIGSGGTWTEIAVVDSTETTYQDDYEFEIGTTYYYRIREYVDGVYSDYSNETSVTYTTAGTQYQKTLVANISISSSMSRQTIVSAWLYKKVITVNADMVDEDVTYFPLTTYLTSDNFDFTYANYDGSDIRFSSDADGTNLLKYEKVEYGGGGATYSNDDAGGLKLPDTADFEFGTGDYCVELTLAFAANGTFQYLYDDRPSYGSGYHLCVYRDTANYLQVEINESIIITSSSTLTTGSTYNIAVARVSGTTRLFINGTLSGSAYSTAYTHVADYPCIGTCYNNAGAFIGTYYGVRVTKGTGRYTTTYTPPSIYSIDSSSVKACINFKEKVGATTFIDSCGNTITKSGTKTITAIGAIGIFNVLIPSISSTVDTNFYMLYGNAVAFNNSTDAFKDMTGKDMTYNGTAKLLNYSNGAKFDGDGDYLTLADSDGFAMGSGSATWEFKVNFAILPTSAWDRQILYFHKTDDINNWSYMAVVYTGTEYVFTLRVQSGGANICSDTFVYAFQTGVDYDLSLTKSGTTTHAHVNGIYIDSGAFSADHPNYTGTFYIGATDTSTYEFNGYMRGARITKGTARYTDSNHTPPTFFIKDTNTVLCMNFQELEGTSTFYDACGKTVTTVGSVVAYRTGEPKRALVIDGADGNYLSLADSDDWTIGTDDFTMEFLLYHKTLPASTDNQNLWSQYVDASNYMRFNIYYDTGVAYMNYGGTTTGGIKGITGYALGVPYHIAVSRTSGVAKIFVNGVQCGTDITDTANYPNLATSVLIGAHGGYNTFDGQIRGCRFTKGTGRYTTTFTPPTSFTIDSTNVKFCSNFDSVYDKNYKMVQHLGNTLTDASGNGNNGTATGTTLVDTVYGKARSFGGANTDKIACGTAVLFTTTATILMLSYLDDVLATSEYNTLISKRDGFSNTNMQWQFGIANNGIAVQDYIFTKESSVWETDDFDTTIVTGQYKSIALKRDATSDALILDGTLISSHRALTLGTDTTAQIYIGNTEGSESWDGILSETRISDIARSDTWILLESLSMKNSATLITISEYVPGAVSLKVNIGGTWKLSNDVKVNIGGVWKTVESIKVNINGVWKSIT